MKHLDESIILQLFESPSMDYQLASRLKFLSSLFLFAFRKYERQVKHVNLKSVCNNFAFLNSVLHQISRSCPMVREVENLELTTGEFDCSDVLSNFPYLMVLHFTSFKLNLSSFSCLLKIRNLRSLSIGRIFLDDDFNLGLFTSQDWPQPKLNLDHLEVNQFDEFSSLCDPNKLQSLSLSVQWLNSSTGDHPHDVTIFNENLKKCSAVEKLKINVGVYPVGCFNRLLGTVEQMPSVKEFNLEGGCARNQDWDFVSDTVFQHLTKLLVNSHVFNKTENLRLLLKFEKLRHFCHFGSFASPSVAFRNLPQLQTLQTGNDQWRPIFLYHRNYKILLYDLTETSRYVTFINDIFPSFILVYLKNT